MSRPVGCKNQPKRALIALLEEKFPGYNPILEMAKLANDKDADPKVRFDANKEIAQYTEAKRKAVEITGNVTSSLPEMLAALPSATEDHGLEEEPDKVRH